MNSDKIEKRIVLRATRERVWRAISDSKRFGTWFGVEFDGPFVEGEWLIGRISPTKVDPEVARLQEPAIGMKFSFLIERIEPMERLSFRWHPFAIDPGYDYSNEPTTRVVFELRDADSGILLTITESGFDQIPVARRAQALEANDKGWSHQTTLIEKYLAHEEQFWDR
jgi:uncharacterized protein YndB with AHSA1/START domain